MNPHQKMPCHQLVEFCSGCGHFQRITTHTKPCLLGVKCIPSCRDVVTTKDYRLEPCGFCQGNIQSTENKNVTTLQSTPSRGQLVQEFHDLKLAEAEKKYFKERQEAEHHLTTDRINWDEDMETQRLNEESFGVKRADQTLVLNPYTDSSMLLTPVKEGDSATIISNMHPTGETDMCNICQDILFKHRDIRRLPCGRKCVFCLRCVAKWFEKRETCPNCRHRFRLIRIPDYQEVQRRTEHGNGGRRRHRPSVGRNSWSRVEEV